MAVSAKVAFAASDRAPPTENAPAPSPGANVPPACTVTPAESVPVPRSVPPDATVTAEVSDPSTASTPPDTVVAPV